MGPFVNTTLLKSRANHLPIFDEKFVPTELTSILTTIEMILSRQFIFLMEKRKSLLRGLNFITKTTRLQLRQVMVDGQHINSLRKKICSMLIQSPLHTIQQFI